MKWIFLQIFITVFSLHMFAQEKKFIRRAERATERVEYAKALAYYDKALDLNKDSYEANTGKGIVLGEFMERYDQAVPYLEKALALSSRDTLLTIYYTLGKCYHYLGEYKRAIACYSKLLGYGEVGNEDFPYFLEKDISDCNYALAHTTIAPPEKQLVKNVGPNVNTEFPEYVPIFTKSNDLIFTSKRKDNPKEKVNKWDGKYFESMYISKYEKGNFSTPKRFTLPDLDGHSRFSKYNESSISLSPDGRVLFIYKGGDIYMADVNDSTKQPVKLDKKVNFTRYQNHAALSKDSKTLFFSSESEYGMGGTDIYMSVKNEKGEWSKAQLLDSTINTIFNEDAPFISDDGILYFSSTGHPGYGGYDIYKTRLENGHWTIPENLGQPINSPGHDIYFTLISKTKGYYSSARSGDHGDLDIYSIEFNSDQTPECNPQIIPLAINMKQDSTNHSLYTISLQVPQQYSDKVVSYSWKLNNEPISFNTKDFNYIFNKIDTYNLSAKITMNCDTCRNLIAACAETNFTVNDSAQNIISENENQYLTDVELKALDWNSAPLYYDYNGYTLRADALAILNHNIEILKRNKNLIFYINGYSDSRGDEKYNLKLSASRANIVKQYLIENGIENNRLKHIEAYGELGIVNNCHDGIECEEAQHQLNRRVEVLILNNHYKQKRK